MSCEYCGCIPGNTYMMDDSYCKFCNTYLGTAGLMATYVGKNESNWHVFNFDDIVTCPICHHPLPKIQAPCDGPSDLAEAFEAMCQSEVAFYRRGNHGNKS